MKNENELSVPQAARKLRCIPAHIYRYIYGGKIKAEKIAGRWHIPAGEIDAMLERGTEWE